MATFDPYMHESTLVPGRPPEHKGGVRKIQENMGGSFPKLWESGMKLTLRTDARHENFVFGLETLVDLNP